MEENDLILISSLGHYAYCPRQCGLMFVEGIWADNVHTIQGSIVHERVDRPAETEEDGVRILRALPLRSERYGLTGKADVVEIHGGVPVPVEYKKGRTRKAHNYEIQLCAQGLCLEEMFGYAVPVGYLYHAASHRRREIRLDQPLREKTLSTLEDVRNLLAAGKVPPAEFGVKCRECSLKEVCLPELTDQGKLRNFSSEVWTS